MDLCANDENGKFCYICFTASFQSWNREGEKQAGEESILQKWSFSMIFFRYWAHQSLPLTAGETAMGRQALEPLQKGPKAPESPSVSLASEAQAQLALPGPAPKPNIGLETWLNFHFNPFVPITAFWSLPTARPLQEDILRGFLFRVTQSNFI